MTEIDDAVVADENPYLEDMGAMSKLSEDLKEASRLLSQREVRYLVDLYYQCQDYRIATAAQNRALKDLHEPNQLISWALGNFEFLEKNLIRVMDRYTMTTLAGRWQRSVVGIGPVIAAGLSMPNKSNTVGATPTNEPPSRTLTPGRCGATSTTGPGLSV